MEIENPASIYETGEYLSNNSSWHQEDSPKKAELVAEMLSRHHLSPTRFVEVGCGAGAIISDLADRFPDAEFDGYDISPQAGALNRTRETSRTRFHHADFLRSEGHYDCLLALDVFEHVPDYMGFLRALSHRADHAVFHIPMDLNAVAIVRGYMLQRRAEVGHLHYFNRDTALATLRDCGYEIVDDYYAEWFHRLPRPSIKNKLTGWLYRAIFRRSQALAVNLFGDCSLVVLARPA